MSSQSPEKPLINVENEEFKNDLMDEDQEDEINNYDFLATASLMRTPQPNP